MPRRRRRRNPDLIYGTFPFVVISGDNHQPVALHAVSPPGVVGSGKSQNLSD
jgi:hypothetical protein